MAAVLLAMGAPALEAAPVRHAPALKATPAWRGPALEAALVDTLIRVDPGARLVVRNHQGTIAVRTWDRPEVRLAPSPGEVAGLKVSSDRGAVRVTASPHAGGDGRDLQLTVPRQMNLELSGPFADISVEDTRGHVTVETVSGDVRVRGGAKVGVRAVEGDVTLEGVRESVQVSSVDGDVRLTDVTGDVSVDAIDGDVILRNVRSESVRISTVDGDVRFDGEIRDGGRYRLVTHDGTVAVSVPSDANVTVAVSTYAGDFTASFPVTLRTGPGKRFDFALGTGSARLELEAFDGEIRLVRPGEELFDND